MFSAYPDGWPGLGLLLLRAAAAGVLTAQGIALTSYKQDPGSGALATASIILGVLLLVGFLTRFATMVAAIGTFGSMFSWFHGPKVGLFQSTMTAAVALLIAAAILSLGSGAYSIDARLFGRREIIIPQHPHDGDV